MSASWMWHCNHAAAAAATTTTTTTTTTTILPTTTTTTTTILPTTTTTTTTTTTPPPPPPPPPCLPRTHTSPAPPTRYGTASEPLALACYQAQTGQSVDLLGFKLWGEDPAHSWLGVSPDGLVQGAQASELLPGGWAWLAEVCCLAA
jgi:hypothetical protein